MTYFVYLARCADDSLYCGICKDLEAREATHNAGKGAKYTRARLPIQFVYHEECESRSVALKREAEIKKWTKTQKEQLAELS